MQLRDGACDADRVVDAEVGEEVADGGGRGVELGCGRGIRVQVAFRQSPGADVEARVEVVDDQLG